MILDLFKVVLKLFCIDKIQKVLICKILKLGL